jgi:hypothetical protein
MIAGRCTSLPGGLSSRQSWPPPGPVGLSNGGVSPDGGQLPFPVESKA